MNTILKKSNMYIIGGCLIVIFITIGILIYILTRKKSGGGGGGYKYTEETLSEGGMSTVCAAPYSSSDKNYKYVANLCDLDPDCKGYYGDEHDEHTTWYVATDTDPSDCDRDKSSSTTYNKYFKKPDYNEDNNESGQYGCQLKTNNTCENKVCADGNYVEKLCNLDPDCVGYYTSDDKIINVATNNTDVTSSECSDKDLLYGKTTLTLFNRRSQE
jgi:hypothetical protein